MDESGLARDLGFRETYALGLGTMIGAGIFVLPGIVAEAAGPASMLAFTAGGLVALCAALSLSELATGMPRAGGSYYYVNHALGGLAGTIVGLGMWVGLLFATAFYMRGFGQYLLQRPSTALPVILAALSMALGLVAINYVGVRETASLQSATVVVLVVVILGFLAVGLPRIETARLVPITGPGGWVAVGATTGTVFVTFLGFEVIATTAEEVDDPGRVLPLSMTAAVLTPTVLYVLVMLVSLGLVSVPDLAASDVPVATVAREAVGPIPAATVAGRAVEPTALAAGLMILGAILATISSANASILSAARVTFAMGRDRVVSDWLNRVHPDYRTPTRAILATGIGTLALIVGPVPIVFLADVAAFLFLLTYALVHVALVVLRRSAPAGYDPAFRIPGPLYPAVPALGLVSCVAILALLPRAVQVTGLAVVLASVGWYGLYARERATATTHVREAMRPPASTAAPTVVVAVPETGPVEPLVWTAAASAHARDGELVAVSVLEVPPQTSPAQVGSDRLERQRARLDWARDAVSSVPVRTRAVVGRSAAATIRTVVDATDATLVVLGWRGQRPRREVLFGSTVDPILERAPCEVSLVRRPTRTPGEIVAFVADSPNASVAARRAADLAAAADAPMTLVTAQPVHEPVTAGQDTIAAIASAAGLEPTDYHSKVVRSDEVGSTLAGLTAHYDTVCLGATGRGTVARALYGSVPRQVADATEGTVVLARGRQHRTGISRWLRRKP